MKTGMAPYVTPAPWWGGLQRTSYATSDTYARAAAWLWRCRTVADWGGGSGHFGSWLPTDTAYHVVDGTRQAEQQTLADLRLHREPAEGILLRHVLDINTEWPAILTNALASFQRRMVVVTFTPDVPVTGVVKLKSGWPIVHFNPDDLRQVMGSLLVVDEQIQTTHPERVYYLERRS